MHPLDPTETDGLAQRQAEAGVLLEDGREVRPQTLQSDGPLGHAVEGHPARGGPVEAEQAAHEGALAGPVEGQDAMRIERVLAVSRA